jgi:hypothetical protein
MLEPNNKLHPEIGREQLEYLNVIKYNYALYEQIFSSLLLYNNQFIRTSNAENLIYIQLLETSKKLFPNQDASVLVSSLLSVFFTHALSMDLKNTIIEEALI